jgi:hypothetical protein
MIIPINDKYRLKSDVNQWNLQRFSPTVKEPDKWKSFKYFHDPSNAVTELIQMMVRESDVATLADALVEVRTITRDVLSALYPHFEVKEKT